MWDSLIDPKDLDGNSLTQPRFAGTSTLKFPDVSTAGDRVWMKDNLWHIRAPGSDEITLAAKSVRNNSVSCFLSPDERCDRDFGVDCNCTFLVEQDGELELSLIHI